jgi:hypothetical protein
MTSQGSLPWGLIIASVFACLPATALGQTASADRQESKLATITASASSVRWKLDVPDATATLIVAAPDGRIFRREFKAGAPLEFTITDNEKKKLPDGQYTYELRLSPVLSREARRALAAQRGRDTDAEAVRTARKPSAPARPLVESGSFSIVQGAVIVAGEVEPGSKRPGAAALNQLQRFDGSTGGVRTVSTGYVSPVSPIALRATSTVVRDQVIPDDLIVQGSTCIGFDCVNNESFGFDTIRLKENNLQIQFEDTSTSAGFPTNNWLIKANDSASGGADFLGFVDQGPSGGLSNLVLAVNAGAPANSLRVGNSGKVGLRTATPVLDLHIVHTDTPAHRLEQTSAGGFTAQTWDIAGNEANFFVRDVTGGSRLPFRIRPGAPTSSIDISSGGDVGVGTASPSAKLHVAETGDASTEVARFVNPDIVTNGNNAFIVVGKAAATAQGAAFGYQFNSTAGVSGTFISNFGDAVGTGLFVRKGGNVGVGTSAPTDLLSVNGTASKPGGGAWAVFSDRRLKTVTGNFNPGLRAVMQLQPLRYVYRPDNALKLPADSEHVGFEAQAVQKIIPEAVSRNANGYLQIDNDPILWTMLNAIKEQQAQIEQLQQEVRQLRSDLRRDHK